jgi:hypothetical protein
LVARSDIGAGVLCLTSEMLISTGNIQDVHDGSVV